MNAQKGYYSLVQFCPNPSRLETVNVGVLLFCPATNFIEVRTAASNRQAAKLFGRAGFDSASLNSAKRAFERRLTITGNAFRQLEDLQRFVDTRANVLKLTSPRSIKVFDPTADLEKLFAELVGGRARQRRTEPIAPKLDLLFRSLEQAGRARLNWKIQIPVLGRQLHIPYAFRNRIWNLVKPYRFSCQAGQALNAAMRLAIEGDLIHKHGQDEEGEKKLIIVSSFEEETVESLVNRVEQVLREYHVEMVRQSELSRFVTRVELLAH